MNRNMPGYGMNYEPRMRPDYPSAGQPSKSGSIVYTGKAPKKRWLHQRRV